MAEAMGGTLRERMCFVRSIDVKSQAQLGFQPMAIVTYSQVRSDGDLMDAEITFLGDCDQIKALMARGAADAIPMRMLGL